MTRVQMLMGTTVSAYEQPMLEAAKPAGVCTAHYMDYSPLAQPCANDFAKGGMYSKDNTVSRMEVCCCPSRRCPSAWQLHAPAPHCRHHADYTLSDARVPNSTCGRGCTRASRGATTRSGKCPAMATPERGARLLRPRRGRRDAATPRPAQVSHYETGAARGAELGLGVSSVTYRRRSHVCWSTPATFLHSYTNK